MHYMHIRNFYNTVLDKKHYTLNQRFLTELLIVTVRYVLSVYCLCTVCILTSAHVCTATIVTPTEHAHEGFSDLVRLLTLLVIMALLEADLVDSWSLCVCIEMA